MRGYAVNTALRAMEGVCIFAGACALPRAAGGHSAKLSAATGM